MKISVKFSFLVKKRFRLRWAQSRTIHNGSNHKTEWQNRGNNEILRLSKICRQKQTHYVLLYLNQSQTEKIPCGVILSKKRQYLVQSTWQIFDVSGCGGNTRAKLTNHKLEGILKFTFSWRHVFVIFLERLINFSVIYSTAFFWEISETKLLLLFRSKNCF